MIALKVRRQRTGPVIGRHPWVFSGALLDIPDGIAPGAPVKLLDEAGLYLASGYFNSYSQIAVRIWGHDEHEEVDRDFFIRRIRRAYALRRDFVEDEKTDSYRLIHGENDLLPGLVVDRYADYLVLQCHTKGMERWKETVIEALEGVLNPKGIYERSDVSTKAVESLEAGRGLLRGDMPDLVIIRENGLKFLVDVKHGQKTGFFLDQRDKRRALVKYAMDRRVLNCFSYTGGFTVYALAGGARHVLSLDASRSALDLARENVRLNGLDLDRCEFVCADAKKYLWEAPRGSFELVVLDPPAFIKDRRKKNEGLAGYRSINEAALGILTEGGILLTCSCSAHLTLQDFRYLISQAGGKMGKSLFILESHAHSPDHPALAPYLEGDYLKCFILSAGGVEDGQ